MKILIVEDESTYLHALRTRIERIGHIADGTVSISLAKEYIDVEDYDLLIVDLNMKAIGFTPMQYERSRNGLCTGWIWLSDNIFPQKPRYIKRTAIVTSFRKEFEALANIEYKKVMAQKIPIYARDEIGKDITKIFGTLKIGKKM